MGFAFQVILPEFALAVDFNGLATEESLQCLKDSEYKTIFLEYDFFFSKANL